MWTNYVLLPTEEAFFSSIYRFIYCCLTRTHLTLGQFSTVNGWAKGLSTYKYPISTKNPLALGYFNQILLLSYGCNHTEAARSFHAAANLDPNCAMCY
jgi:hypothetical protein